MSIEEYQEFRRRDTQPKAVELVLEERKRQDKKWGTQRELPRLLWYAILGEEFGEVGKACLETVATFEDDEQVVYGEQELLEELTQVAAVALCWIEDLLAMPEEHIKSRADLPGKTSDDLGVTQKLNGST